MCIQKKFIHPILLKKIKKQKIKKKYLIKTLSRSSTIYPCFLNLVIYIYNGKRFYPIKIYKNFIGHKLGEFIHTRFFGGHKKHSTPTGIKKKIKETSLFRKYYDNCLYKYNILYNKINFFKEENKINLKEKKKKKIKKKFFFNIKRGKINYIKFLKKKARIK